MSKFELNRLQGLQNICYKRYYSYRPEKPKELLLIRRGSAKRHFNYYFSTSEVEYLDTYIFIPEKISQNIDETKVYAEICYKITENSEKISINKSYFTDFYDIAAKENSKLVNGFLYRKDGIYRKYKKVENLECYIELIVNHLFQYDEKNPDLIILITHLPENKIKRYTELLIKKGLIESSGNNKHVMEYVEKLEDKKREKLRRKKKELMGRNLYIKIEL